MFVRSSPFRVQDPLCGIARPKEIDVVLISESRLAEDVESLLLKRALQNDGAAFDDVPTRARCAETR
jgi:hypothetical protein